MRIAVFLSFVTLASLPSCSESNAASSEGEPKAAESPVEVAKMQPAEEPVPAVSIPAVPEATEVAEAVVDAELKIDIRNARYTDSTVLLGGQPSETEFAAAADKGYQCILTLRGEGEPGTSGEQALVAELGMRFAQIPMTNGGGFTEKNARALAAILDDPSNRPLMVHCGSGNRVGGLFALKAFYVDGMDADAALEVGRKTGMRASLEARVKAAMK